jgi:hypothetical protein
MSILPQLGQTQGEILRRWPLLGHALLHHRTIRGDPMDFTTRPFQVEMYADFNRIEGADIVKAVQTGQSEMFTVLSLHQAGWEGRIVAYVQPVDRIRNRFVSTRVNPLLRSVPEYRQRLPGAMAEELDKGDTGSLQKKAFGSGLLLFLGAKTDGDFVELTADTFIVDEYDSAYAAGPHNLERVRDRLKEAKRAQHFRLGNPEIPRGGIEALYSEGDQRLYHWRCAGCGERQPIDWLLNVVDRDDAGRWVPRDPAARKDPHAPIRPLCRRCGRPFAREAQGAAWVPLAPLSARRSYRPTRFDVLSEPFRALFDEWIQAQASAMKLKEWWRRNAGRAHEEAMDGVTEEQLRALACLGAMDHRGGDEYRGRAMTAGIDVGALLHVTISESVLAEHGRSESRVRWTGTVRSKDQAADLLRRYRVRTAVIDQDPETRMVEELQRETARFGCTLWLCRFHATPRTTQQEFGMRMIHETGEVRVDRTQVFDVATEDLHLGAALGPIYSRGEVPSPEREGARLYPSDALDTLGWIPQMEAPRRIATENGTIVWSEGDKADHFRLADVYDRVARELDQMGGNILDFEDDDPAEDGILVEEW